MNKIRPLTEPINQVSDQGVKSEVPGKEVDEIYIILSQYANKSAEELYAIRSDI